MKILIINGSPRINGDTESLISIVTYIFFRNEEPVPKPKRGAVILVGGGDGHMDKAYGTACTLLHHMHCYNIHEVVFSHNTNERLSIHDEQALMGVESITNFFNNVSC